MYLSNVWLDVILRRECGDLNVSSTRWTVAVLGCRAPCEREAGEILSQNLVTDQKGEIELNKLPTVGRVRSPTNHLGRRKHRGVQAAGCSGPSWSQRRLPLLALKLLHLLHLLHLLQLRQLPIHLHLAPRSQFEIYFSICNSYFEVICNA